MTGIPRGESQIVGAVGVVVGEVVVEGFQLDAAAYVEPEMIAADAVASTVVGIV